MVQHTRHRTTYSHRVRTSAVGHLPRARMRSSNFQVDGERQLSEWQGYLLSDTNGYKYSYDWSHSYLCPKLLQLASLLPSPVAAFNYPALQPTTNSFSQRRRGVRSTPSHRQGFPVALHGAMDMATQVKRNVNHKSQEIDTSI